MAEDPKRKDTRRRPRRNKSATRERVIPKDAEKDKGITIDVDYFAKTYGIDFVDFAEVTWGTGKPKLVLRGRSRV